jgi:hypothetical protein
MTTKMMMAMLAPVKMIFKKDDSFTPTTNNAEIYLKKYSFLVIIIKNHIENNNNNYT